MKQVTNVDPGNLTLTNLRIITIAKLQIIPIATSDILYGPKPMAPPIVTDASTTLTILVTR